MHLQEYLRAAVKLCFAAAGRGDCSYDKLWEKVEIEFALMNTDTKRRSQLLTPLPFSSPSANHRPFLMVYQEDIAGRQ